MSNSKWTQKASELLRNFNTYKTSVQCMRGLLSEITDEELSDKLRQTERLISCMELAMTMLTDEEQFFLDRFFINAGERPVDDICAECMMEKSNAYRLRKKALEKFTMAMYGRI